MTQVLRGGCLCGGVRYAVDGPLTSAHNCHCTRCRRFRGAAHACNAGIESTRLRIVRGEHWLRTYRTDGFNNKTFCSACGSSLFGGQWPEGERTTIPLGTLDGDPGVRPGRHIHVASNARWHAITDELPQFPGDAG